MRRIAFPALLILTALATLAHAQPAFEPLPDPPPASAATASSAPPQRIVRESRTAGRSWSELEASVMRRAARTVGSFDGVPQPDGRAVRIHYRWYEQRGPARGGVIVVPGRTEGLALYQETLLDLVRNGWSVYVHDHRGQGFSSRLLDDDRGHVHEFDDYVRDLDRFAAAVRERRAARGDTGPLHVLAHSMGGAVVSLWLQQPGHGIARAALVTPMHEPLTASGPEPGVLERMAQAYCDRPLLAGLPPLGSLSTAYVTGGDFDAQAAQARFEGNDLTHSPSRWQRHQQARREARCDGPHCGHDTAKVGGPTLRWFNQSCDASRRARGEGARAIAIPVLLLQGSADTIVSPLAQQAFCAEVNAGGRGSCTGHVLPDARHAVLIEADRWRVPALRAILAFFAP